MKNYQHLVLSILTVSLFSALSAHAVPVPPDAGQSVRELQQQPNVSTPNTTDPVRVEGDTASQIIPSDSPRITIKTVHVSGSTIFQASELEALTADLVGGERSFADIRIAAARITAFYRAHGYMLARAYLPSQEVKSGIITIAILEGRIEKVSLKNNSLLTNPNGYLDEVKQGGALQQNRVERSLLLLNDTPGVNAARATVQPGASVGTSDLLVELDPAAAVVGNVELDNYGNRYTGENRLGGMVGFNSPLGFGDQLTLRALATDKSMTYLRLAYQIPVGVSGLRVGAAFSNTAYNQLAKEFAALQANGSANSASLYASYPFIRSLENNLSGTFAFESKMLTDKTNVPIAVSDKRVQLMNFGLTGNHIQAGQRITSFELGLASGKLSMDAASLGFDNAGAKTSGGYSRLSYSFNHQERLTETDAFSAALSGQQASKNLNSSEKFSLGGANGVRAYPQGEGIGDQGWLASLEVRHHFMQEVQGVAFYDAGSVATNKNPFVVGAANNRSIAGAGVGANVNYSGLQFKAFVAWRTSGGQPTSEPVTLNRNPRLWIQMGAQF